MSHITGNSDALPREMRAAVITTPGGPEVLNIQSRPLPTVGCDDVLVRIQTSALNRADLLQRIGRYAAPPGWPSDIPGLEFAGEVVACGSTAKLWTVGDRVFGLAGGGAHAEYIAVHERTLARVPHTLSWEHAGAAAEVYITVHDALVTQAELRPGNTVLIHAVGSGVGLAAVQLARALGAVPYGTARGENKIAAARENGLENGLVVTDVNAIAPAVQSWTGGRGVDVVLDLVGGDYIAASLASIAPRGRIIAFGSVGGRQTTVDLGILMSRRATLRGTVIRARPLEERIEVTQAFAREVVPWLANGTLRVPVETSYRLSDIAVAHARLESNETIGKVALQIAE